MMNQSKMSKTHNKKLSPEFRAKVKAMLIKRNMELAQDEEVISEYVELMRKINFGPEFIALVQAGKNVTDEQLEAVINMLEEK